MSAAPLTHAPIFGVQTQVATLRPSPRPPLSWWHIAYAALGFAIGWFCHGWVH